MKDSKTFFKKLGFTGIGLCVACCFIPTVGLLFGMGALTSIAGFLEIAGIIAMVSAIVFFSIYFCKEAKSSRV